MTKERKNPPCIFCFKSTLPLPSSHDNKFIFLFAKYLRIDPSLLPVECSSLLQDSVITDIDKQFLLSCEDCLSLEDEFCKLYFDLESIRLKLEWTLRRIYERMVYAGRVPSRFNAFRTHFETSENGEKDGDLKKAYNDIKELRKLLINKCNVNLKSAQPKVGLQKISKHLENKQHEMTEKLCPTKMVNTHGAGKPDAEDRNPFSSPCVITESNGRCLDNLKMLTDAIHSQNLNLDEQKKSEVDNSVADDDEFITEYDVDESSQILRENSQELGNNSEMDAGKDSEPDYEELIIKCESIEIESETNAPRMTESLQPIEKLSEEIIDHRVSVGGVNPAPQQPIKAEGATRKSTRSRLQCSKCFKTFANETSLDLHLKSHENESSPMGNSDSGSLSDECDDDSVSDYEMNTDFHQHSEEDDDDDKSNEELGHSETEDKSSPQQEIKVEIEALKSNSDEQLTAVDEKPVEASSNHTEKEFKIEDKPQKRKSAESSEETPNGKCKKALTKPQLHRYRDKSLPPTECEVCHASFSCEAAVEKHRVLEHSLRHYRSCRSCGKMFASHKILLSHRTERKSGRCATKDPSNLQPASAPIFPHIKHIVGNKFCPEEGCFEVFEFEESLQIHLQTHGKWGCTLCPEEFSKAHEYAWHELTSHNTKTSSKLGASERNQEKNSGEKLKLSCTRCDMKYGEKRRIIDHFLAKHLEISKIPTTSKGLHQCDICKKVFSPTTSKKYMKRHFESEHNVEGMDPATISTCLICKAPFRLRVHLSNHLRVVHRQAAEMKCLHCSKVFTKSSSLRLHLKQVHKGKGSGLAGKLECEVCKERFDSKGNFERHKMQHQRDEDDDGNEFQCEMCPAAFTSRFSLNRHIYTVHKPSKRTLTCETCGKLFKNRTKLDQHINCMHTDPKDWKFVCEEEGCGKKCWSKQKLSEHQRTHSKETAFVCDLCGAAYKHRHNLRAHVAKVHGVKAAKSLQTQQYTKPFHDSVTEKVFTETDDESD